MNEIFFFHLSHAHPSIDNVDLWKWIMRMRNIFMITFFEIWLTIIFGFFFVVSANVRLVRNYFKFGGKVISHKMKLRKPNNFSFHTGNESKNKNSMFPLNILPIKSLSIQTLWIPLTNKFLSHSQIEWFCENPIGR